MAWMLDTNICVALIRSGDSAITAQMQRRKLGSIGISSITLAELEHGVRRSAFVSQNAEALAKFLVPLAIHPFDDLAAHAYGRIRAELDRKGTPIGPLDTLIAAHALSRGDTLVTRNVREFKRVAELRVADWSAA
jgi:tRNA(fMet)-specific endonuclease VapC